MPCSLIVLVHVRLIAINTMAKLLPFDPYRAAWKHCDVGYLDYGVLQSHNWKSKQVFDTHTHRVDSSVHTAIHKTVHDKLHKVSHGMFDENVHI